MNSFDKEALKIYRCIKIEQQYLNPNFDFFFFSKSIGVPRKILKNYVYERYKFDFNRLLRFYRVNHLKLLASIHGRTLSYSKYAQLAGFKNERIMKLNFRKEVGIPFQIYVRHVALFAYNIN